MKLLHKNVFLLSFLWFLFLAIFWNGFVKANAADDKITVIVTGEAEIGEQISVRVRIRSEDVLSSVAYTLAYEIPSASGMTQGSIHESVVCEEKEKYFEKEYQFDAPSSGTASFWVEECYLNNMQDALSTEKKVCQIRSTVDSNALLKSLEVEGYELEFSPEVQQYTLYVPYEVTQLVVLAKAQADGASVSVQGNEDLQVGNNQILVKVTSADSDNVKQYLIDVVRAGQEVSAAEETSRNRWLFRIGESPLMWPILMLVLAGTVVTVVLVDLVVLERKKDTEKEGESEKTNTKREKT